MEQSRKRLVELLTDIDYITNKDSKYSWWKEDVTVGCINKNYSNYKYTYSLRYNYNEKNGIFYIDYDSIWLVFEKENNMSYQQIQDFTESTLGERYNFGDIATELDAFTSSITLGERYNFGDIATDDRYSRYWC